MAGGGIVRDGAQYRIAPLTTYARPDDMRRWCEGAAAGHRCTYAVGPKLGQDAAAELARSLEAAGKVRLSRQREGQGWRYFMERRPAEDPAPAETPAQRIAGRPEGRLLDALTVLAEAGDPLPSLEALAELAGLPHRQAASYRLRLLVDGGYVTVREDGERRFIEIGERA